MKTVARRKMGRTGLDVTELGFGGAALGNLYTPVSDADARETLSAALNSGINLFDTAPHYGFGLSERRIGDALRTRHDCIISSKVGRLLHPVAPVSANEIRFGFRSPMPFEPVFDYTHDGILRSYEDSLHRLGRDRFDIALVHDIGRMTHGDAHRHHFDALTSGGGFRALEELKAAGAISAIGLGVNEWDICLEAMEHAALDVVLLAGRYTLLEQTALDRFLPAASKAGIGVILGGVYNSGILAGARTYNYETADARMIARVERLAEICARHDTPLPAAALQFALAHPSVSSVIPGVGSAEMVTRTIALYATKIPPDLWAELKHEGLLRADAPTASAS